MAEDGSVEEAEVKRNELVPLTRSAARRVPNDPFEPHLPTNRVVSCVGSEALSNDN